MGECHNPEALELASALSLHLTEVHFPPTVSKGNFNTFSFWRIFDSLYVEKKAYLGFLDSL